MQTIGNIKNPDTAWTEQSAGNLTTLLLGKAAGSKKIYVNLDQVPPGRYSTKYHSHTLQEEFFLVVKGSGILRLNGQEIPVGEGDFFAKPAGQGIAHTFYNNTDALLEILDVGTTEPGDTSYYPDDGVVCLRGPGDRRAFSAAAPPAGWTSDPNE